MSNPFELSDKVIFITGAFGLIGRTLTRGFLEQGARVALCDSNHALQREVEQEFSASLHARNALIVMGDITSAADCAEATQTAINHYGRIDVLINNAAIDAKFDAQANIEVNASRFEEFPIAQLERSMQVNITGTVQITQAVVRQMLKQGYGNIINVASTYSLVAPNQQLYDYGTGDIQYKPVDYIITKSMIPNFTRYLATFYAKDNIRCNAIAPHGVFNNHPEAFVQNFEKLSPMGRMSGRDELIGPFSFLASDASSYMTGSILTVDGGWTAW